MNCAADNTLPSLQIYMSNNADENQKFGEKVPGE